MITTAALVLLLAQEKVSLVLKSKPGEKITVSTVESSTSRLTLSSGGQALPPQDLKETETRTYVDEILQVDQGQPSKVRRTHSAWVKERSAGAAEEKETRALQGRTIVLSRVGAETTYEDAKGVPESELKKNRLRVDAVFSNLPAGPVAPGASWPLDEKMLREQGDEGLEFQSLAGTGTLEKVEEHQGRRCGVIRVDIAGKGRLRAQPAVAMELNLTMRVWLDLDAGRPLTLKGEGGVTLEGQMTQGGQTVALSGTMTHALDGRRRAE